MSIHRKAAVCLLGLISQLFFYPHVFGCTCLEPYPSVRDAYNKAEGVFIGTVTKVEDFVKTSTGQSILDLDGKKVVFQINGWKMYIQVEKTYKGAPQQEIILEAENTSCSGKFDVGKKLLLYANPSRENGTWRINPCSRSGVLTPKNDDISFLEGLPKNLERTRISGHLQRYEPISDSSESQPLAGIRIKIAGKGKTHELITDKNGFYEIYDLPIDEYIVTPEIPKGLKIQNPLSSGFIFKGDKNSVQLNLNANKCIGIDFSYRADNRISGKILDVDGKPLKGVCLGLMSTENNSLEPIRSIISCTKEDGSYILNDVPSGKFLIMANRFNRISSNEPFPRLYYPNTFDRQSATVLNMGDGDIRDNVDIHVPSRSETITLNGIFLYSDGNPAAKHTIEFAPDSKQEGVDGISRTQTDSQGRFSISVLKGLSGMLYGKIISYIGEFKNCPEIDQLIRQGGKRVCEARTEGLQITTDKDLQGIELKFPFPACKEPARSLIR
jgi:hypothetical protein